MVENQIHALLELELVQPSASLDGRLDLPRVAGDTAVAAEGDLTRPAVAGEAVEDGLEGDLGAETVDGEVG